MRFARVAALAAFALALATPLARAQGTAKTPMSSDQIFDRISKGVQLRKPPTDFPASQIVLPVFDMAKKALPLGSATRICLGTAQAEKMYTAFWLNSGPLNGSMAFALGNRGEWSPEPLFKASGERDWWITPAHVIGARKELALSNGDTLRAEMLDPSIDLALLSGPKRPGGCAYLSVGLNLIRAPEITGAYWIPPMLVGLEGPLKDQGEKSWDVRAQIMATVLGASWRYGYPGRDDAGTMLTLLARGVRGQSGSAVLGYPDDKPIDRSSVTLGHTQMSLDQHVAGLAKAGIKPPVELLLGMLVASDPYGTEIIALPAPTIYKRLIHHFRAGGTYQAPDRIAVPGGTKYLESGAVHRRGFSPKKDSGTGTGGGHDSGTGGGHDSGTGGGHDSGTGGGHDSGTGGGHDSGGGPYRSGRASGIFLGDRLWLTIGDAKNGARSFWNEYEPYRSEWLPLLKTPEMIRGIYEKKGRMHFSHPEVVVPSWHMNVALGMSPSFGGAGPDVSCHHSPALARQEGQETGYAVMVFRCERRSSDGGATVWWQMLPMHARRDDRSFPRFTLRYSIARDKSCKPTALDCPAVVETGFEPRHHEGIQKGTEGEWMLDQIESMARFKGNKKVLVAEGLRTLFSRDGKQSFLFTHEGYRFRVLAPDGSAWQISGPGVDPSYEEILSSSYEDVLRAEDLQPMGNPGFLKR